MTGSPLRVTFRLGEGSYVSPHCSPKPTSVAFIASERSTSMRVSNQAKRSRAELVQLIARYRKACWRDRRVTAK